MAKKNARIKAKPKRDYEVLIYFGAMIITLILHYFLISKIKINSTFQVAIDFFIVLAITGIISEILYPED